jgi:hypothetical protein
VARQPHVDGRPADTEAAHVPTADRVAKLFERTRMSSEVDGEDGAQSKDEEELEEIDFADIGRLQAEIDAAAAAGILPGPSRAAVVEVQQRFTGFRIEEQTTTASASETHMEIVSNEEQESAEPLFFIDTNPAPVFNPHDHPAPMPIDRLGSATSYPGVADSDDEEIVYVAPHPRHGRSLMSPAIATSELPPTFSFPTTSILTGTTSVLATLEEAADEPAIPAPVEKPVIPSAPAFGSIAFSTINAATPPRRLPERRVGHKPRSLLGSRARRQVRTGRKIFGGMGTAALEREESQLRDSRRSERRRGDSDLDWGDEEDEAEDVDMEVDMDADVSVEAMQSFVRSMGQAGSRHVTMEDVEIEARIRLEDAEEERGSGSSDDSEDDAEVVFDREEKHLVGEALGEDSEDDGEDDDDDSDSDDDDEDDGPQTFQARLDRLRKQSAARASGKGKGKGKATASDEEDDFDKQFLWEDGLGDEEDEYLNTVQVRSRSISE